MPEIVGALVIVTAALLFFLWFVIIWLCGIVCKRVTNFWNLITGETRRREEQERQDELKRQEAEEARRRRRREAERKQREAWAAFETTHMQTLDGVAELISSCGAAYTEAKLGTLAVTGKKLDMPAEGMLLWDIKCLFLKLVLANDSVSEGISKLFHAIRLRVLPSIQWTLSDSRQALRDGHDTSGLTPGMITVLSVYDQQAGTQFASKAAAIYRSIALVASDLCNDRMAVKMVVGEYLRVLNPYIKDGDAGNTGTSSSRSNGKLGCERCANGYRLLDLPYGASHGEVNSKRLALSEVLHPDKLGDKSERARLAAEQQLKSINEACSHILQCTVSR